MVGGFALQVALGIIALALVISGLGPVVGYFLVGRRIDVDVHPGALLAKPYPEDADGLRRYDQLLALGFRPLGWTSEHARFFSPLHWRWRAVQGSRWLLAPDGHTFASLFRVVEDEPVRFSAVTLFDDGGSVTTTYPGATIEENPAPRHAYFELRGVGPAELLAKHAEHVERHRQERGLAIKSGTLTDVAETSLDLSRAYLAKQRLGMMAALPLALFGLPLAGGISTFSRGAPARVVALGGVILMGLFYTLARQVMTKPRRAARHMHTREFDLEQTAVASDGTIEANRHERWLRLLAVLGALDMVLRLAVLAWKVPAIFRSGAGTMFMAGLIAFICANALLGFVPRVSGRTRHRGKMAPQPTELWSGWGTTAILCSVVSQHAFTPPYLTWLAVPGALAFVGWWLEKNGRA